MISVIDKFLTQENNEVQLISAEPPVYNKTILIIGVFHGEEPQGEFLIKEFLNICEPNHFNNRLLFIPCLNPDGKAKNKRQNSNGVDLNRNFPTKNWELISADEEFFGGNLPASEVETNFIIYTLKKYRPDAILTIHAPFRVVNFDGPAEYIAQEISQITGYPIQQDIGYPTPGSFGTYCGVERNIPTITLELPEDDIEDLWLTNKEIFNYLSQLQ